MDINQTLPYQLMMVTGNISAKKQVLEAATEYASGNPLYLSIGGGQTNTFFLGMGLPYLKERSTGTLKRIYLVDTYTCYEATRFLEKISTGIHDRKALFSLDFLNPFYDESVPYSDAKELLEMCIRSLKAISQHDPVMISADPPKKQSKRTSLFDHLRSSSDFVVDLYERNIKDDHDG